MIENAYTLEEIEKAVQENRIEALLISPDDVLSHIERITIDESNVKKITNGIRLRPEQLGIVDAKEHQLFRIYFDHQLLCVLKVIEEENRLLLAMDKSFY